MAPEAAVIASPATHHVDAALPLARAGVHLLVEKPLAASARGAAELVALCEASGVTLMTGYNLRFLPSLQQFRALLAEQRVGRVLSVRASCGQYLPAWRPNTDYRAGVSACSALGGGVLLELSHELDYLRWLFGEVGWVSATLHRQSDLEIDVEDTAHLVLGFTGTAATTPVVASLDLDFVRHDWTRTCVVIGESGTLRWNGMTGTIDLFTADADGWRQLGASAPNPDESYVAEWRHFLACVRDGSRPSVSGRDGLAVLELVDAARASAAAGAVVRVTSQ